MKGEDDMMKQQTFRKFIARSLLLGTTVFFLGANAYAGVLFSDTFESGNLSHTENGFGWNGTNAGSGDGLSVSTDIARSGTRSVKFTFGGGPAGADAWSELRYILGKNMTDVYIQWYQYFPDGTEGLGPRWTHRSDGISNNKLFKLWADKYTGYTVMTGIGSYPLSGGNSNFFTDYGTNQTGGNGNFDKDIDRVGLTNTLRGRWVKFQYHVKTASSANNDGVLQLWVDDVLTINNTDMNLYPLNGVGNYFRNGYFMGWSNSGFAQTTNTYVDDVTISDTFISGDPLKAPFILN